MVKQPSLRRARMGILVLVRGSVALGRIDLLLECHGETDGEGRPFPNL